MDRAALVCVDRVGLTPLHLAVQRRDDEVALACAAAGGAAAIAAADRSGKTALHLAARHSTLPVVEACLAAAETADAFDFGVLDSKKRGIAHYAARNTDGRVLAAVHSHCHGLLAADCDGQLPIHQAARFGHSQTVAECLRLAGPSQQLLASDRFGRLALHYAASASLTYKKAQGCAEVAAACLAPCAKLAEQQVLHSDHDGKLPASHAGQLEGVDVLKVLQGDVDPHEAPQPPRSCIIRVSEFEVSEPWNEYLGKGGLHFQNHLVLQTVT